MSKETKELIKSILELNGVYDGIINELQDYFDSELFPEPMPRPEGIVLDNDSIISNEDCVALNEYGYTEDVSGDLYFGTKEGGPKGKKIKLKHTDLDFPEICKPEKRQVKKPKLPIDPGTSPLKVPVSKKPIGLFCGFLVLLLAAAASIVVSVLIEEAMVLISVGIVLCIPAIVLLVLFIKNGAFSDIKSAVQLNKASKQNFALEKQNYEDYSIKYEREIYPAYQAEVKKADEEYEAAVKEYNQRIEQAANEYKKQIIEVLCSYPAKYKEYAARKQAFEEEKQKKLNAILEHIASAASQIAKYEDILPAKYVVKLEQAEKIRFFCGAVSVANGELKSIRAILEAGRAESLKEAINIFISDERERQLEEMREAEREEQEREREEREMEKRLERFRENDRKREEEERARSAAREQSELLRRQNEALKEANRLTEEANKLAREEAERKKIMAKNCPSCRYQGTPSCSYASNGAGCCKHYYPR